MRKIKFDELVEILLTNQKYENIIIKDGDNYYHKVDSLDLMYEKISCDDGWCQYFNSFKEGYCEIYIDNKINLIIEQFNDKHKEITNKI